MKPLLPDYASILPYLNKIDAARIYTNNGPLIQQFEERIGAQFGLGREHVVTVSNATTGISLCLTALAQAGSERCMMPAWTFEATAVAAIRSGYTPFFVDVSAKTWAVQQEKLASACKEDKPAAIIVVSPFGAPLDGEKWDAFSSAHDIPVVLDCAAGFDSLVPSKSPAVVSLHATKALACGEGGFVISTDTSIVSELRSLANFGFVKPRRIDRPGMNAKLSEYAAAVGNAALDHWMERREAILLRLEWYLSGLAQLDCVLPAPGLSSCIALPTLNVQLPIQSAAEYSQRLAQEGIESRRWWGSGCHRQPAFACCGSTSLAVTDRLATSVLGLPFFADISKAQIGAVIASLSGLLNRRI